MRPSQRRRASARALIAMSALVAAALTVLPSGVAHAEPPSNDDFDASTVVTALPYATQQDTGQATEATDDPFWCQGYNIRGTVWFSYTPQQDVLLRASTAGSDHWTILAAHTGDRGGLVGVPNACGIGTFSGATITFAATAGTTYHFMVAGYDVPGGGLDFALDTVPAAPNDDFADAEPVAALPTTVNPDLSTASVEFDEPRSACGGGDTPSVWYTFTSAEAVSLAARIEQGDAAVAVYSGSTLLDLREVGCAQYYWDSVVFRAQPGVTHFVRVAATGRVGPATLSLAAAPDLVTYVSTTSEATIYGPTSFHADVYGLLDQPIVGGQWDFGDGSTAPVDGAATQHQYAADGTYQVRVTVVSADGRTGTGTASVEVETHDVSIRGFSVPSSARVGQTKPVTVKVGNTRYQETATVRLLRSDGTYWAEVGSLTLTVPARPTRTVDFPFAYTFTPADAGVGVVTFRAVVELPYPTRDARPMDNEVIAVATTVLPPRTSLIAA
jgi:hypothetical protein